MVIDPSTTKYMIKATIKADGVIEKSDVVGAIFGQTEGLLGDELDLRELQRSARVGRIEVELDSKNGKSEGAITLPTSLDKVETVILAAAFESIDRVGPCKATIKVDEVEDVRVSRRKHVIDRAKDLLNDIIEKGKIEGESISDTVRQAVQIEEITNFGPDHCPAGPHIEQSDAVIIVEGRRDVLNLLKYGIKNVIAVGGTNIPKTVVDLTKEKITTVFVDGDRGGELILRELLQIAEVDFVARAPQTREVEEIPQKLITKALKNKIPAEQFADMYGLKRENKQVKINKEQDKYKQMLKEITGTHKGILLDKNGKKLEEINVDSLVNDLKDKNPYAIVFDGITTQRLIDMADGRGVKKIISIKKGDIIKKPSSIELIESGDLGI